MGQRAEICVAIQRKAPPDHFDRWQTGAIGIQDQSARIPGVVSMRLLRSDAASDDVLVLVEYRDEAARAEALALLDRDPPPAPMRDRRVFVGRLCHCWDRF